jgi:hypothetical protein
MWFFTDGLSVKFCVLVVEFFLVIVFFVPLFVLCSGGRFLSSYKNISNVSIGQCREEVVMLIVNV